MKKQAEKQKKFLTMKRREALLFWILILPFLILFIGIKLVPLAEGLYLSFTNYTGYNYDRLSWAALRNYKEVLADKKAMSALKQTFVIGFITVPISMIIGLGSAVLLNRAKKGLGVFRTIIYIPAIIPAATAGLIWKGIFSTDTGVLNYLLNLLGFHKINWLGYDYIFLSLIIMMTWSSTGTLLTNLAALQRVPETLYEAAQLDGAGSLKQFTKITLPMISPILFFNLILGIIGSLQLYGQPVLLTSGTGGVLSVPLKPVYTYMVHAYQQLLAYGRFGYGLAMIWVLVILINLLTFLFMKTQKYWVFYD